jgi:hypothetical protein
LTSIFLPFENELEPLLFDEQVHPRAEMTLTPEAVSSSGRAQDEKRRVFKTHAPWHLFPVGPGNLHPSAKIVRVLQKALFENGC